MLPGVIKVVILTPLSVPIDNEGKSTNYTNTHMLTRIHTYIHLHILMSGHTNFSPDKKNLSNIEYDLDKVVLC